MGKLDQLISRLKRTPMNVGGLKKLLPAYATFKTLSQLTEHRSKVFGSHDCVVVLIPSKFSSIGHFVVLVKFPKYIEYFSSFGGSPKSETQKLGQRSNILLKLLGRNYVYNSLELQSSSSTIQDCALFVLARVKLRKLKLREFQELFKGKITLQTPDDIVSMLGILLVVDL
jgi:hypothetical protein